MRVCSLLIVLSKSKLKECICLRSMQTQRRCELSVGLSNCVVDLGTLVSFFYFGPDDRYDITYDVIYANQVCNAGVSHHIAGTV